MKLSLILKNISLDNQKFQSFFYKVNRYIKTVRMNENKFIQIFFNKINHKNSSRI